MLGIFVSTMQQGQHRHLSLVFWNGAGYALQENTVLVGQHMKENAQKEHTGEFHQFLYCASSLVDVKSCVASSHVNYILKLQASKVTLS